MPIRPFPCGISLRYIRQWRTITYAYLLIIETAIFTKGVNELLDDEQYRLLQWVLVKAPDLGKIIPGSGGLRKLRWAGSGRGKRGGIRLIYYWLPKQDRLLMLFLFAKNEQADLTAQQLKTLRLVVQRELGEKGTV